MPPLSPLAALLPVLLAACSSGFTSTVGTCQNPSAADSACDSCTATTCSSQYASEQEQCPGLGSCEAQCQCSDTSCLQLCANQSGYPGCVPAEEPLAACRTTSCASACSTQSSSGG